MLAGELSIPFTSGILIGIGETREERIDACSRFATSRREHGHLREVIVQNFRAKPGTRMAGHPDAPLEEHLWSIAVARIVLGPDVHVQAPPNLAYDDFPVLLDAGIDDWGGVSPVTVDHVNPEAPWPDVERLREACRSRGLELAPRLPLYPEHVADLERWADPAIAPAIRRAADALGLAREDRWAPGEPGVVPFLVGARPRTARARGRRARRGRARAALPCPRRRARAGLRRSRPAAPRGVRRRRHVRRDAERPVHERLLLPLRVLRLLEGKARREPSRPRVPRSRRRDRPPRPRGMGAGRHRGVPPGRNPSGVHGRLLRECGRDDQGRRSRDARPRVLGARDLARRCDARPRPRDVPRSAPGSRPRLAARHGGRDPRRRGARGDLPGQGDDRRSGSRCTPRRTASGSAPT